MHRELIQDGKGSKRCGVVDACGAEEGFHRFSALVDSQYVLLTVYPDAVASAQLEAFQSTVVVEGISFSVNPNGLAGDHCASVVRIQIIFVAVVGKPTGLHLSVGIKIIRFILYISPPGYHSAGSQAEVISTAFLFQPSFLHDASGIEIIGVISDRGKAAVAASGAVGMVFVPAYLKPAGADPSG